MQKSGVNLHPDYDLDPTQSLTKSNSVRPSDRNIPVLDENGLTYRHNRFHHTVAQSF